MQWTKVKKSIYKNIELEPNLIFAKKWGKKPPILLDELLDALHATGSSPKAMHLLGRSEKTFITNIKKLFPKIKLQGGGENWLYWFISKSDYKKCGICLDFKDKCEFSIDNSSNHGLDRLCKSCKSTKNKDWYDNNKEYHKQYLIDNRSDYNARTAKRRAALLQAIPP